MTEPSRVAVVFRDHAGWANVVGVVVDRPAIEVVLRERVTLVSTALPRQAYHAAEGMPAPAARMIVDEVVGDARRRTQAELGRLVAALAAEGHAVDVVSVGLSPDLPAFERILASHALLHAAEGALYRDLLVEAAEDAGLAVHRYNPKDVVATAAAVRGVSADAFGAELAALGKPLGAPWQADHKMAVAAGMLALRPHP